VTISWGSVERVEKAGSYALDDAYAEVLARLDSRPVRCADQACWRQADRPRWLSVAAGADAALFQLADRRDRDATIALLGEKPSGTIVSDRYAVCDYMAPAQRQLCLAHPLGDFTALGERSGAPSRLGRKSSDAPRQGFSRFSPAMTPTTSQPSPPALADHRQSCTTCSRAAAAAATRRPAASAPRC
jgi:hypothetical protein